MARPRPVHPGTIYLVTRRCARRQFLLRPGKRVNQAVLYCLAQAASREDVNVQIFWFMTMSNHLHYGVYDPDGSYPLFIEHFHKMLAKVLNCHWGRWGNLFECEQTSVVELADANAIFDKMIYSLANPVAAHLVKYAAQWPGATSLHAQLADQELVVQRPAWFFAERTAMPEEVRIRFHRPPPFRHLSHNAWTRKIRAAIAERERRALEERRASGRRVMGVGAVRAQSAFDYPDTPEPRRQMNPRVATKNKWRRIEVLQRNREWLAAYVAALDSYRAGNDNATFPPGTWKLWQEGHVLRAA